MRSPPPAPPPTAAGGKRGSIASSHTYQVNISPTPSHVTRRSPMSPSHRRSPMSPAADLARVSPSHVTGVTRRSPSHELTRVRSPSQELARLSPAEKRELLYGPGGPFGPTGPFSTPEISRYPEVTQQTKRISFADLVDGKSDQSGFAEDRSDKSQYVSNPVISFNNQSGARSSPTHQSGSRSSPVSQSGKRSSPTVSRVDSYHLPNKSGGKTATKTSSTSTPATNQDGGDAWVQEKQKRMLNWINRSQVALGARISGKNSN